MHVLLIRIVAGLLAIAFAVKPALASQTLDDVRKRGHLICGVSEGLPGFSAKVPNKGWQGFDVDFCRAVTAAIFGDATKVTFVPLSADQRFQALTDNKIDLLSRNTTWTMSRDVKAGLDFAGIIYFDGQGFMVPVAAGLSSALQLTSSKVCSLAGTTTADNAKKYFKQQKLTSSLLLFSSRDEALKNYRDGKCDAYTADLSALASQRTQLPKPDAHMLLPEIISKEPLGPVVRQSDPKWRELVQWVLFLLVNAEEQSAASGSSNSAVAVPEELSASLGLKPDWAKNVLTAVGHYGDMFDRSLGSSSLLKISRGANNLWTRGGLMYAPPLR